VELAIRALALKNNLTEHIIQLGKVHCISSDRSRPFAVLC
jgi:hypothetical protein